jgi:hypothetical protein
LQCQNAPYIGDNSCVTYFQACTSAKGVGDSSCNGYEACFASGPIGDNSCNSSSAVHICTPSATVGNYSCNVDVQFGCSNQTLGDCVNNTATPAECLPKPDAQIRRGSSTTYEGNNVYSPTYQAVGNSGAVGQKLTFFILIENDSVALSDRFKVKRSGLFNSGFRVRYYDAANNDVTGRVNTGTFTTPLVASGAEYVMRATVKIRPQAIACSSPVQRTMTATSVNDSSVKDAVSFAVGLNVC